MTTVGPIDPAAMRRLNAATTLRELHRRRSATLTQLTDETGLSRRTLELILGDFVSLGQAAESFNHKSKGAGRPARQFTFEAQHAFALALQIGQDSIEVMLSDLYGAPLGSWSEPVSASTPREERLDKVRGAVTALFRTLDVSVAKVAAVTVSTMGVVGDDGIVELKGAVGAVGPSVADWSGFSLSEALSDLFPCEVVVENDAKLAAVGEGWRGGAQSASDYVYVLAEGRRVGIGVVIGGKLYRGLHGQAGEIYWAQPVFGLGEPMAPNPLLALDAPRTEAGEVALDLARRARSGDSDALRDVNALAGALAPGLHAIACLLSPEVLVLGGAFSDIGAPLVDALGREFDSRTSPDTRLTLTELGNKAVLLGALRTSLDRIESNLFGP
ncbi:putative NBD/HSP70 family sugar kinase [Microbacteriaceae bacterium SG_E_30_P1]|uniref:NBD/HSP70 family sugar kinase n=1 Tax=Antiquaquibacter oligotrophicus TaxID=2880260 RepID=A0ABT6KRD3_9MICO|nr:ROK family protein [Antiquaquibacter oligotrophicus]MDH6181662.1 putative NBD/HSP70 family sugar kinase [Antiquaquibacter oligotrophicus]UDF12654.1 ROK family protein [Antiquaquibacter oligotrophicus]